MKSYEIKHKQKGLFEKEKIVTEKEVVEKMYEKHQKWVLDAKEAPKEWGRSYSYLSKLFGGKDSIPDSIILEKQIIPPWIMYGERRMWKITDIANWIVNTELKGETKQ